MCIRDRSRIEQYGRTVRAVYPILKDKYMKKEVKREIYEGVLKPILLYGAETWSMTEREESRIQTAEMNVLRTVIGKTRRKSEKLDSEGERGCETHDE